MVNRPRRFGPGGVLASGPFGPILVNDPDVASDFMRDFRTENVTR